MVAAVAVAARAARKEREHATSIIRGSRPPPLKRRRRTRPLHHSSTGTDEEEDEENDHLRRPPQHNKDFFEDPSSSEHDNPHDDDYTTEEAGKHRDGDFNPRHSLRTRRHGTGTPGEIRRSNASSNAQNRPISAAGEEDSAADAVSDDSAAAAAAASLSDASSSSSSVYSPNPLSAIEVNRGSSRNKRGARVRRRSSKGKTAARKVLRRDLSLNPTLARLPISPVKLLPPQQAHARRGFQVRPDILFTSTVNHRSNGFPNATLRSLPPQPTRTSSFPRFRKFADRVRQTVSNIGTSGHTRPSVPGSVRPSAEARAAGSKRKRGDSSLFASGAVSQQHPLRASTVGHSEEDRHHYPSAPHTTEFAAIQPLRRTRSLAKQMEKIGVHMSDDGQDNVNVDEADQVGVDNRPYRASASTRKRRGAARQKKDNDRESVEGSIAEMSLDETSEQQDEQESAEDDPEDDWYLSTATSAQLHRLRKDKLLRLALLLATLDDEEDKTDCTKDALIKLILDARDQTSNHAETEEEVDDDELYQSERASAEDFDLENLDETSARVSSHRYSMRHQRRSSAVSTASSMAPTSSQNSPRGAGRRNRSRSKVLLTSQQIVESSANESEDEQDQRELSIQHRRKCSMFGLDHPSTLSIDRTPGRLRSGKLRASTSALDSSEQDEALGNQFMDEEEDDNTPTPITRRTSRLKRNLSMASVSSAGFGDDEDGKLPNHEYRLRKVSLPRRSRRGSAVQSEEDEERQEEQDDSEIADSEVEAGEDAEDEEDEENELDHDEFDLASATQASLLRLRRDDLIRLCEQRELSLEGTKKELATALLEWRDEQDDQEEGEPTSTSDVEEGVEEGVEEVEEDDDYEPSSDISMVSLISEKDDGEETETSSLVASPARSDATARLSSGRRRGRNETKTQALARLSNKDQSYNPKSRRTPLLLQSHQEGLVHGTKVDTPPGSGDTQDNDLELDLESLNLLDKEIAPDKLKKGGKIGSGGFKDVYEGRYRNVKVALADIRGHLTENDLKELGLLRDLRHENIVRFIGVSVPEANDVPVTIVSELCSNGDLFDYIRNVPPPSLDRILSIMLNIARGIEYLHKRKPAIIHRDLKSSNVLITAKGVAKVTDFGLARVRNTTRSIIKSLVGTVNWQAPELWVPHPRYNEKVDVYSAGLVYWECLQWHLSQKRYPFEGMNEHAIYQEVGQKHMRPPTATMRRQWGGDILDLVDRMWAQDPKERPNMTQVVEELEKQFAIEKEKAKIKVSGRS